MEVSIFTQDGTVHKLENGKLNPPVRCPSHIHERVLRRINQTREEITRRT